MSDNIPSKDIFPVNNQQPLPNATASLVLGILSIVFCFTYGVVGVVLGIIGLVLANKDRRLYHSNPDAYSYDSYKNVNAGRTCAIIGLILSGLIFLIAVVAIIFAVSMATALPFYYH